MQKPFAPLLLILFFILAALWVISAGFDAGDTKTAVLRNILAENLSADKISEVFASRQQNPLNSDNSESPSGDNPSITGEVTDPDGAGGTQTQTIPAATIKPVDLQPAANGKATDPPVENKPPMPEEPPVINELPAPAQPQPIPSTSETDAMVAEMLGYINAARGEAGSSALILDGTLCQGAYLKAKDMGINDYFSHQSPTYGSAFEMMKSLGISYCTAAENIARNYSAKGAFDAFMNSPGHRTNILNSDFDKVGLGFWQQGSDLYVTQWFTD
jgi:uncharacterized protein YkwD